MNREELIDWMCKEHEIHSGEKWIFLEEIGFPIPEREKDKYLNMGV